MPILGRLPLSGDAAAYGYRPLAHCVRDLWARNPRVLLVSMGAAGIRTGLAMSIRLFGFARR